jgi:hypothetical protein
LGRTLVDVLHYDGYVYWDDVKISATIAAPDGDEALVLVDAGGAVVAGSRFIWNGGWARFQSSAGVVGAFEPATIQLTETPDHAIISNIGIGCEDAVACFEINDEDVNVSLSDITVMPAIGDVHHGLLFRFKDYDHPDGSDEDTSIIKLSDFHNLLAHVTDAWADVFADPIDHTETALTSADNIFGTIHWTAYSASVSGTGAEQCFPGWTLSLGNITDSSSPSYDCQAGATLGAPTSSWAEVGYHPKRIYPYDSIWVDGTVCQDAGTLSMGATGTVKSVDTIVCGDSDDGVIELSFRTPTSWRAASDPTITLSVEAICDATNCTATSRGNFKAKCVGQEIVDDTWGTESASLTASWSSETDERRIATGNAEPYCPGSCAFSDRCWIRYETSATATGSLSDVHIVGLDVSVWSSADDW